MLGINFTKDDDVEKKKKIMVSTQIKMIMMTMIDKGDMDYVGN